MSETQPSEITTKVRRNGLNGPWNKYQVVFLGMLVTQFVVSNLVLIPSIVETWAVILYVLIANTLFLTSAFFGIWTTLIDPAGKSVSLTSVATEDNINYSESVHEFGNICNLRGKSTDKHCMQCNKCIKSFDHHGGWLNTGIGGQNYHQFIAFVVCIVLWNLVMLVSSIVFIACFHTYNNLLSQDQFSEVYGSEAMWVVGYILMGILLLLTLIKLSFSSGLLGFHAYLKYNDMSTYEFIKLRREAKLKNVLFI